MRLKEEENYTQKLNLTSLQILEQDFCAALGGIQVDSYSVAVERFTLPPIPLLFNAATTTIYLVWGQKDFIS